MSLQPSPAWSAHPGWLLLLICGVLLAWITYVLYRMRVVERNAAPRRADVAIVLGAAIWGEQPSPGLRERLDMAVWLFEQGYTPYLIVTGGVGKGQSVSEAVVMKRYLVERGVPAEKVLTEDRSTTTYENLRNSIPLLKRHRFATACIVSHGYHLARALNIAAMLQIHAFPVAAPTSALNLYYHTAREVLAYTKWKVKQLLHRSPC